MGRNNKIKYLKTRISIRDVCLMFNIEISSHGQVSCPDKNNHKNGDRNPSMKIYENTDTFYCFKCGKGGDIIDLVSIVRSVKAASAIKFLSSYINTG